MQLSFRSFWHFHFVQVRNASLGHIHASMSTTLDLRCFCAPRQNCIGSVIQVSKLPCATLASRVFATFPFMAEKTLLLLDSFALAFRMFYAYSQNPLVNSKGEEVSMMHGYWGAVLRILAKHKPTHFAIARDVAHTKTFRHELYPDYKANRGPMPEEMAAQMPLLCESLEASGIPLLSEPGYEADDVMASAAEAAVNAGFDHVVIISKDKDMSQIVTDKIHLFHLEKAPTALILDRSKSSKSTASRLKKSAITSRLWATPATTFRAFPRSARKPQFSY